jgi:ATP-dependent DNA helicase RecQ
MKSPKQVLKSIFGYTNFQSSQEEIINSVINGENCLVLMPTGGGKSLCYQIPALLLDGLTVVISPLISLMKDQTDALLKRGVDTVYINSSLSKNEKLSRYESIKNGRYQIIFVSPERFQKKQFVEALKNRKISLLALDEAHCMSQWGNDFRPDYSKIKLFRKILNYPTTIALTATATAEIQKDIIDKSGIPLEDVRIFNEGICRPNLSLGVIEVIDESQKFQMIVEKLRETKGSKIVYFNLIKSIGRFSEFLDKYKITYSIYHGKLNPSQKKSIQNQFMKSYSQIILATNAFGMGIDKSDIRLVIHAEIPDSIESYYQEIGRSGRDGLSSECLLFYSMDDLAVQIEFLQWKNPDIKFITSTYKLLKSLEPNISSFRYEDIQEKLIHKNKGDHRLQSVLSLFDQFGISSGQLENGNFALVSNLSEELISENRIRKKMDIDKKRLIDMMNYSKLETCRRDYIHEYFSAKKVNCGNCDNCFKYI